MSTKTKQRNRTKLDTNVAAKWVEEILKPKSLYELWVMNEKKFPFKAVKVVSTVGMGGGAGVYDLYVGAKIACTEPSTKWPNHFVTTNSLHMDHTIKAWRLV